MARPATKVELEAACAQTFEKLTAFIDSLPAAQQAGEFPPGTLNRNIRDVLAHLHHWHLMFLQWYEDGMKGLKPEMPAKGYTWKEAPALNREINSRYKTKALKTVRAKLEESHKRIQQIIASHSNDELFRKRHFPWTGSTSLGSYLVSATSSHYDWAYKFIKKSVR